jgi:hypothetical protein
MERLVRAKQPAAVVFLAVCLLSSRVHGQSAGTSPAVGRWDLEVIGPRGNYPSWVELYPSGFTALVGRYVGRIGGARPIGKAEWTGATVRFSVPPQWERGNDLTFEARVEGDTMVGQIVLPNGSASRVVGRRAPSLQRRAPTRWRAPTPLFNGRDLAGWKPVGYGTSNWVVRDGALRNSRPEGQNLSTTATFDDFKLHVEFRYPRRSDSGIFLRGRYEVQIHDDPDRTWPSDSTTGAIYAFLIPNQNAGTGPDTWQSMDITLIGRRVTVVVNGAMVIADQIIPGLTGSALDSDEGAPGPIVLQGEEREIEFRSLTISVPDTTTAVGSTRAGPSCADEDAPAAAAAVRARLDEWVRQSNSGDAAGIREIWAPGVVGWFPGAGVFSDSTAWVVAGVASGPQSRRPRTTYTLTVDDIAPGGSVVAVHDVWTERKLFGTDRTVERTIRGSELWRCQADGRWRIARYVSAPEPWRVAK